MCQQLHQGLYILLYLKKNRNKEKHRGLNDGECLLWGAVGMALKIKWIMFVGKSNNQFRKSTSLLLQLLQAAPLLGLMAPSSVFKASTIRQSLAHAVSSILKESCNYTGLLGWCFSALTILSPRLLHWGVALPMLAADRSHQPPRSLPAWSTRTLTSQASPHKCSLIFLPSWIWDAYFLKIKLNKLFF